MHYQSRCRWWATRAERRRPAVIRPRVEPLEDRLTPADFAPLAAIPDGNANSLRDVIRTANFNDNENSHTINLEAGVYQLTLPNAGGLQENDNQTGDLDIFTDIDGPPLKTYIFQGVGAGRTIIDGGGLDRVFSIVGTNVAVVFRDLTIRNGTARDDGNVGRAAGLSTARGGGLFIVLSDVTLERVILETNLAQGGAGQNTNFLVGPRTDGQSAQGGGIFLAGGTLNVRQSALLSNQSLGGQGGSGRLERESGANGGHGQGGGAFLLSEGAANADAFFVNSTLSGNTAQAGDGGKGGDGNVGGPGGNGGLSRGGGVHVDLGATAEFNNSTVAANRAVNSVGGLGGIFGGQMGAGEFSTGGGVYGEGDAGLIRATSSIFADNLAVGGFGEDVTGMFSFAENNLVEDPAGAQGIANGVDGNIVGRAPSLEPLQNNGGPTPTHALGADSPAFNAGSNPFNLTTDQRGPGFGRAIFGAADIGAFEFLAQAQSPPPAPAGPRQLFVLRKKQTRKQMTRYRLEVYFADTGELKKVFFSPYNSPPYAPTRITVLDTNGDGIVDSLRVRATHNDTGNVASRTILL